MSRNELITIAQRLREYVGNPHHIDPMSDSFKQLVSDASEALSQAAQPQGEPVAYRCRHSATEPWFFSDKPGYWEWQALYAEQPAPVAVARLEMAHVVRAHMEIPGCPVLTSNQCHALAIKLNESLDELKRLNLSI